MSEDDDIAARVEALGAGIDGPGHIVFGDGNVEDEHIAFCINECDHITNKVARTKELLLWLLSQPVERRRAWSELA